jgi:hypothetical protein
MLRFLKLSFLVIFLSHLPFPLLTFAQQGCTDQQATNYDPQATSNNGTCIFPASSSLPLSSFSMSNDLIESSGLLLWESTIYSHNDDGNQAFYSIDPDNGSTSFALDFDFIPQNDWEEVAQDDLYFYVGDFGNNENGNRQDLRIYKILKSSLFGGLIQVDTIEFSYPEQVNFSGSGSNNTDFDCEAMIVSADSIYLFTKEWNTEKTSLYALDKTSLSQSAHLKASLDVDGLITGATAILDSQLIVLTGYSDQLEPFFYLLYDFQNEDFFSANKRKIDIPAQGLQIEAIVSEDALFYYVTNEGLSQGPVTVDPQIHTFNLADYLDHYFNPSALGFTNISESSNTLYPNPSKGLLNVTDIQSNSQTYSVYDFTGRQVAQGQITSRGQLDVSHIKSGKYFLDLQNGHRFQFEIE